MPVRGVIFDLFHTLTGLESEWSDLPGTWALLGLDRRAWDEALTMNSRWRVIGELRDPFEILRRLVHQVDASISHEAIREALDVRLRRFRDTLARIPAENLEAIRSLRRAGLRVGLVSNADVIEVASWPACAASEVFDTAIFSCYAGMAKPEHGIYRKCLEELGLAADECVFVGDGGSDELVGAREVGLKTVFISGIIGAVWPERVAPRKAVADHHTEKLPEILKVPGLIA